MSAGTKRARNVLDDAQGQLESYHRQLAMRATERAERVLKKEPPTADPMESKRLVSLLQPIDALTLLYNMHYADRKVPSSRKVVDVVNNCPLRASHPALFEWFPLEPFISDLSTEQRDVVCKEAESILSGVRALQKSISDPSDSDEREAADVAALVDCNAMWGQVVRYIGCLAHAATIDLQSDIPAVYEGQLLELVQSGRMHYDQLAAELHALAALEESDATNPRIYRVAYSMCLVHRAQQELALFEETARQFPLDVPAALMEEFKRNQALLASMRGGVENYTVSETDALLAMEREGEQLRDDEELFNGEVLQHIPLKGADETQLTTSAGPQRPNLRKPFRFSKVKTGYVWNQYNKTHYDTRTNPPPKQVRSYEFTLFYPDIAADPKRKPWFEIVPTEKGWGDEFVILVIKAGPPYADIAYRIVNKQWDARDGSTSCTFDEKGKFRLYFRLTDGGYRR